LKILFKVRIITVRMRNMLIQLGHWFTFSKKFKHSPFAHFSSLSEL
jgi:hypothetical protein